MTLLELSVVYDDQSRQIYRRIQRLTLEQRMADPANRTALDQRLNLLRQLRREAREIAAYTAGYYLREGPEHG